MFFSFCALFGPLPIFQTNQLIVALREIVAIPNGWIVSDNRWEFNLICGAAVCVLVAAVVIGGIQRIGAVTSKIVPSMVALYVATAVWILIANFDEIPAIFALIFRDAFTGDAVAGGAAGAVIMTGVRRSAFSNEAGIGSEALAHGAAKTNEPVREGLVAMLGPAIDTLIVCSATAMIILSSQSWRTSDATLPGVGSYILVVCVFFFAVSTMFSFSYYGAKSLGFLLGAERQHWYNYFYVGSIMVGALVSLRGVIGLVDGAYALMAIPTMTSSLLLAPRVMNAARNYFSRFDSGEF
jgi:AGCS family alanine or glycine:cation symporter